MDQAIKASPDIESATAALRSAHELYLAQRGAALPTVDAGYNLSRQKFSNEISPTLNDTANPYTLHTLQVNVGYTPDVFGGVRRQTEGALAQVDAQRFQAEAAYLTLTANVAAARHPAGLADRPGQGCGNPGGLHAQDAGCAAPLATGRRTGRRRRGRPGRDRGPGRTGPCRR